MAATLVGTAPFLTTNFACPNDETGVNLETIEIDYQNPRSELQNRTGQTIGFAVNYDPRMIVSIKGEVAGTNGHAGANFVAVTSIATTVAAHGIAAGGAYLTTCKEAYSRTGYRGLDSTYTLLPAVT